MRRGVLIVCLLLLALPASAAFTVDERSGLHFAASAGIGWIGNSTLLGIQGARDGYRERWPRRTMIFLACNVPGAAKELAFDARADSGDLFFNALGCAAGIALSDQMFMVPTANGVAVSGRW